MTINIIYVLIYVVYINTSIRIRNKLSELQTNYTSTIKLAHKIELIPNKAQVEYFAKACGVSRFAYNWALANWNSQYKNWKEAEVEAKENGTINNLPKPNEYELRKQFNAI